MKKIYLLPAMLVAILIFSISGLNSTAQQPHPTAPAVSASLTLQPDISGLCVGATVNVPIHIAGDNVLSMDLFLDFDHSVLTPAPGPGYANIYPGFTAMFNTVGGYPNTSALLISSTGFNGTNFNGEKLIDLVFIYNGGSTAIHFRRAPDVAPPSLCKMFDEFGTQITPVAYSDNQVSGFPLLPASVTIAAVPSGAVCAGTSVTFTATPVNGGTSPAYQWKNGTTAILGATNSTYSSSTLATGDVITVVMTSNATPCLTGSPATSNPITMTVNPLLPAGVSIAAVPPGAICSGTTVTFTATPANGGTTPAYQWKNGGTIISGATNATYSSSTLANGDVITVMMTSNATCVTGSPVTSDGITMTVNPLLPASVSIAADPSGAICTGTPVTFTATPTNGGTTPAYQWMNGGIIISGATNETYSSATLVNGDVITVVMTSNANCATGSPATSPGITMTVNPLLPASVTIAAVPSGAVCAGTPVTFTATPVNGGTAPAYQWKNGAAEITGATNSTYASSTLATGDVITVVMTSNATPCLTGSPATSNALTMTIDPLLPAGVSIAAVPSGAICAGTPVTFTATPVNGGSAPAYQWMNGAFEISGATNSTYTSSTLVSGDAIKVVMTSNASPCLTGSPATSNEILMTVNPLLPASVSIAADPSGAICAGTPVTFTATPTNGGTTPAFQWKNGAAEITGATNSTYTSSTLATGDVITVVMTSNATCATGSPATSAGITMTVNPLLPASVTIAAVPSGAVCAGTPVTFTATPVNGGTTPAYQWKNGAADITGATNSTHTSSTLATGDVITVVMTSNATPCLTGSPATSNAVTMTVNPLLTVGVSIAAVPSGDICAGTPVTFTATPSNGGSAPAYQWMNGGTTISGATNATYISTTHAPGDAITCVLTSSEACVSGNPATSNVLTINNLPPLIVGTVIFDQAICTGTAPAVLSGSPPNGTSPTYQWQSSLDNNSFDNINGATMQTYQPGALTVTTYYRQMQDAEGVCGGPLPTNSVAITVNPLLPASVSIAAVPSGTVCAGTLVTFTATPVNGGTTPAYQWKNGAADITGATNSTYTSSTLATGDVITVVMTSNATPCLTGSPATSNAVTMTVNPLLPVSVSIAAVPSGAICAGTPVTFTATPANGGATPAYQWMSGGTIISGATNATYSSSTLADGDMITCVLTSSEACVTGNPATSNIIVMSVNTALVVGTVISDQSVCSGNAPAVLSGGAPNGTSPVYQWQSSLDNNSFDNINGATLQTYQPGALTVTTYYRQMQNAEGVCGGPLPTNSVTITVNPLLPASVSIAAVPSGTVCAGTPVTFTATPVNGGTTPAYQWKNGAAEITGATNSTYTSSTLATGDVITVVMTSNATPCLTGSPATSNAVTMTVNPLLPVSVSIAAVPSGAICAGTPVTFTATPANGGATPAYQWMSGGTIISGATNATYNTTTHAAGDAITCVLTSSETCTSGNPATSNVITINHLLPLVVGTVISDQAICSGTSPTVLSGSAPNGTSPAYQWQSSLDNNSFDNINGATMQTYQTGALTVTTYYRQMQNAEGVCGGPLPTNSVTITVNPLLPANVSIAAVPSGTVCAGTPVTFTATPVNGGTTPAYQWKNGASEITGATNSTYTSSTLATGDVITVVMTSNASPCLTGSPATSNAVTMTVNPLLTVGVNIAAVPSGAICAGTPVTFTATPANGGATPAYQWMNGGTTISGATNATYITTTHAAGDAITCVLTSSEACTSGNPATSNVITINHLPPLVVGTVMFDQSICSGTAPAVLSGSPPNGTSAAYQWQSSLDNNSFNNINGATLQTYQPGALSVTTYYRQMQNAEGVCGGPLPTNSVTITVNPVLPVSVSITASANPVCAGIPVTYTATPVNGGATPSYQWKVNNIVVTGATDATYSNLPANNDAITCILNSSEICVSGNPATSNVVIISHIPQLVVGTVMYDQTICSGEIPAVLSGSPPNGTSPVYQWQSSLDNNTFADISGATMQSYQPGALTATTFYRQIQNAEGVCGGPLPTNSVTITVTPLVIVGSISADQVICSGATPAQLNGTGPSNGTLPTYQWQSSLNNNTFTDISGATLLDYQPGALNVTTYYRQQQGAEGTCGPLPTNTVTITVNPVLPVSVMISASENPVCAGIPVTYTATPTNGGASPAYQWKVNNIDVSGATDITYTYVPAGNDAITCVLTSSETCASGNPATSNVITTVFKPALVTGTVISDQMICTGSVPTILSGSPPNGTSPTYQWQSSLDNNTFADISGATTQSYQPGALTVTTYYRQIQDANGVCGGPLPTNAVTITVGIFPDLVPGTAISDQTICAGTAPSILSASPPNGTFPTYQWQSSLDNNNFNNINGATMITYQPGVLTTTTYYRQIQNAQATCGGPLPTNPVTITVTPNVIVGSISANQLICSGTVPAQLNGVGPLNGTSPSYQWQSSLNNNTFTDISGATMLNYQPGALTATTYYRQQQSSLGTCGPLPTNTVTITVNPPLSVGSISANQSICSGTIPAQLIGVAPTGSISPYLYQWQSSLNNNTFTDINGATMLNYQPGALATPTYYRQIQSSACGTPVTTNVVTIDILSLPVPSITGPASVCLNSTGNVYSTQTGMTGYTWTVSAGGTITAGAGTSAITVTWTTTGTKTVTVNYTNANNCTATAPATYNVTVNALPVPTIAGPTSVCVNSTGNVYTTETGMTGYTWTVSAGGTITAGAGTSAITVTWSTIGAKTVTVNYTNANNCTAAAPATYDVTVNALPVPTIAGPASVCLNSTGNVYTTETGMTGYTWTVSAGGTITAGAGTSAITVTWNTTGAQTVTVNYTNANNCTAAAPATYNVTVNALPVPTIAGPASVCLNSTGNVYSTQTGMTGYTWTVSAGGTITAGAGTSAITVTWSATGAQTVTVNYTNANNCTAAAPATYSVTVNALPAPTIAGPASVCLNSTGNVYTTETGMTGYTWTVSAGGTITAGAGTSAITVTWSTIGAKTVTVNYTNANNCTAATPATYNVTVNALPTPTIAGPTSVCLNSTGNVYTTETGMTGYTWTVSAGGTITAGAGTSSITVTWSTIGAKTVTVNYTNANNCTAAAPATYNVTVNALPVPTIAGPASVCLNSTGNVYTTQTGMTGYTWTVSAGGTITAGAGTSAITVTWNATGTQTVTVNYSNANNCTAATPATYNVTVNALPTPTIAGPASVCVNSTGNVYTTQTGMTGYTWTVSAGGTITSGAGTSAITVTWNTAGAQTVSVNYTNAGNCTAASPATYNVTVNALPVPTISGPALACQGNTATYTTQSGMTNYIWTVSAGGTITAGGTSTSPSVTVLWNSVGAQTVTVTYTNICPAAAPATYNVTVNPAPVPTIGSMNNPCIGSTNNIYYTESGMTGYVWTVSSGGTIVSGQGTSTLNVTWNQLGIQTVTVNYTNASGCSAASPTVYTVFVNSPPNAAGPITGTATVCAGTNGVTYSTNAIVGATSYTWTVPAGATIASGTGTTSIVVNFGTTAVSGNITVSGTNQCGNGPSSVFAVTVSPLPAAAGTITGPASVCAGSEGVVYTVPAIANASSYVWTVPAGATITSGATTNTIVVTFGNTPSSGVITVKGTNSCGSGTVSPNFNVTIKAVPAAPVVTAVGPLLTSSVATGNQWYYEGTGLIPGATNQTYTATVTGWYWSVVTVNGCSSDTSNHVYVLFVGQEELTGSKFNVYPVPNDGKFNISIACPSEETFTIQVYSLLGEKMYELRDASTSGGKYDTQIDLRPIARGVYSVVFLNSQYKVVRKMVVNKK